MAQRWPISDPGGWIKVAARVSGWATRRRRRPVGVTSLPNQPGKSLATDGASASAIEAFPLDLHPEPAGRDTLSCADWQRELMGQSAQMFEAFGVSGSTAQRAINGKFVSSVSDGTMRADADEIGADESFVPQVTQGFTPRTENCGFLGGERSVPMDEDVR